MASVDSFDIAENMPSSIGEVLGDKAGVAKRSFGSGSARPVVRGFDGDRVLVVQDGVRNGALGSQSALSALPGIAQSGGQLSGTVALKETGGPMHGVSVLIVEFGRSTLSGKTAFARVRSRRSRGITAR